MRDKYLEAAIKLALCPGEPNGSVICKECPYTFTNGQPCSKRLKKDVYESLASAQKPAPMDLESHVSLILHEIGVPACIKGYRYLREAIMMAVREPEIISMMTKRLYPEVAQIGGTTPSRVERAIRHAIEVAWDRGDLDVLFKYFGHTVSNFKGKPTNSEFISMLADRIRLENKEVK